MRPPSWPAVIFDAPLLRGIDARGRRELVAAGTLRRLASGEKLYREGERGEALFVVGRGEVEVDGGRTRIAQPGDTFGEEASVGAAYRATATARGEAEVASFPVPMLRRALVRAGAEQFAERLERRLRRHATDELLAELVPDEGERGALLDAALHRRLARGETLFEAGDAPVHLFLVVDGTVELRRGSRVVGHASVGETVGAAAVAEGEAHEATARAGGPVRVVVLAASVARPLARRQGGVLGPVVFADLHRLEVARSLLVIDRDHCVDCGHCASTCRSLYGVARLVRRGPTLRAPLAGEAHASSLHVVQACQHCRHAACMADCPTGAIQRGDDGEVRIRDELCTGCGACVKACPWDNVELALRPASAPAPEGDFPMLATKCDLCHGRGAPACVEACPTGAIVRVDPTRSVPAVGPRGSREGADVPIPPRGQPLLRAAPLATVLAAIVGALAARAGAWQPHEGPGLLAGWGAGLALVGLGAFAVVKRARSLRVPGRVALRIHLVVGAVAAAAAAAHVASGESAGTALAVAFGVCAAVGILAAAAYAFVPPRLARMAARPLLPDDRAAARVALEDTAYAAVTGRSDVFKALFARVLVPYMRRAGGWVGWAVAGRSAADERARLRGRIDAVLPEKPRDDLEGLDDLVEAVVEARATAAQRWLGGATRALWSAHALTAAIALALLLVHLVEVWR